MYTQKENHMKIKRSKLVMTVIAMSFVTLNGCGATQDNIDADNSTRVESSQSEQLVNDDSEIKTEVDTAEESTETDVETQSDAAEAESADKEEEESVSPNRDLEKVEFIEADGEYAVTKNRDGVVFKVKCKKLDEKKVGDWYLLEYEPSEAEEIEENVYVIEGEDLIPDVRDKKI